MIQRTLGAMQVAAMLVSASYGIGFLFGSGELALTHGMGGSIYGIATAAGMLLLSLFATRLWRGGVPIWDLFGQAYGEGLKNTVALLSMVWMAGVLAAQIHGGVAIVKLLGAHETTAYIAVLACIYAVSRLDLRLASKVLSFFLLASGLVLVYALMTGSGAQVYSSSPAKFTADLHTFRASELVAILMAVIVLVCTGADYHQFLLAAKRPSAAVAGCVLAGLCLVAVSFAPASLVIALAQDSRLAGLADDKQVIPYALSQSAAQLGPTVGHLLLLGLSAAALGSGASILRAMTSALASAAGRCHNGHFPKRLTLIALATGALLAARGQGIIATMVSVNVVYIGSIGVAFAALLSGKTLTASQAGCIVSIGFLVSVGIYLAGWSGIGTDDTDLLSLVAGLAASSIALAGQSVLGASRKVRRPI